MSALRAILKWVWANVLEILLAVLAALLVGLLAVFVIVGVSDPAWVYRFFGMDMEKGTGRFQILEFIGVGMGGVLLAIGATTANRRAKAMEKTAHAQAKAAKAQADANKGAEDGRRQERLKNAIEHLGHESDSVRLGGAYELFHLARDTEDLRQTVMDILCAHVRRMTGQDEYREKHRSKPSTEIQSLLTLLFMQEHTVFKGRRIDLQGSWLNGASLTSARLQGADLSRAQLRGANLSLAQLQEANLHRAELQEANLHGTELQEADLHEVELQGMDLIQTQLQGANLYTAQLQGANLNGAELQGSDLIRAQLQGVNFYAAQLQGAKLHRAKLQGASLYVTQLQGAALSEVQLQGVTCRCVTDSPFEMRIRMNVGQKSDLSRAVFQGGLDRKYVDIITVSLSEGKTKELREILEPHIGKPASHELPEDSGAIVGTYTEEEAEQWIAEYEEAMRGVPKADG